jgi:hypothetical protein
LALWAALPAASAPYDMANYKVVQERSYVVTSLKSAEFQAFLTREAYPIAADEMYNPCTPDADGQMARKTQGNRCVTGELFRSRQFKNLVFSVVENDGDLYLAWWRDTPQNLTSDTSVGQNFSLRFRRYAMLTNHKWEGRFIEELRLDSGTRHTTFTVGSSYGAHNMGHGYNAFIINFNVESVWMDTHCYTCPPMVVPEPVDPAE